MDPEEATGYILLEKKKWKPLHNMLYRMWTWWNMNEREGRRGMNGKDEQRWLQRWNKWEK